MPAYFWRGTHSVPYGEGCVLVVAEDVEAARKIALARLERDASEDGVTLNRASSPVFQFPPDLVVIAGSAELVEWEE